MSDVKLIADIGINHNGDLDLALSMIDDAVDAGFDYVKFQKRDVELTTPQSRWDERKATPWGEMSYLKYKRRLEFDVGEYNKINVHCAAKGIKWFASPWDVNSVAFLKDYDMPYIKVASAMVTDPVVINAINETEIPVIVSTGMSTQEQFERAYRGLANLHCIMACTSSYPTPDTDMNLEFIYSLYTNYPKYVTGFSNHNPGILYASVAPVFGAKMIEVHTTKDRAMWGSDQAASIEPIGMRKLRKNVDSIITGMGDGEWHVFDSEQSAIKNLRWKDAEDV